MEQRHSRERFVVGQAVEWTPPPEVAKQLEIPIGHPGRVISPAVYAIDVAWVDKVGEYAHEGVFDQDWLSPIPDEEYEARATKIRDGNWAGFARY